VLKGGIRPIVTVRASGFSLERFLSAAAYNGAELENVVRGEDGAVTFETAARGFRRLKPAAKKTGSRLKIISRRGLPFALRRFWRRKALAFGLGVFISALYLGASFIWAIKAEGVYSVPREEILTFLSENGLKFGAFRYRIDTGRLERLILSRFEDIAWASVKIDGTRATVRLAEVIPRAARNESGAPSDITALKSGLVERVVVRSGLPAVKPGDVVAKGDILVSGRLSVGTEDAGYRTELTRASAEVYARRYYESRFAVPLNYTEKNYTGNIRRRYSIILFGRRFALPRLGGQFPAYSSETRENRLSLGARYPLPIALETVLEREYTVTPKTRTPEEARAHARTVVARRVLKELGGARIAARDFSYKANGNFINVTAVITAIERIDAETPIEESGT
jgi:similar to stage IV sporulation protein